MSASRAASCWQQCQQSRRRTATPGRSPRSLAGCYSLSPSLCFAGINAPQNVEILPRRHLKTMPPPGLQAMGRLGGRGPGQDPELATITGLPATEWHAITALAAWTKSTRTSASKLGNQNQPFAFATPIMVLPVSATHTWVVVVQSHTSMPNHSDKRCRKQVTCLVTSAKLPVLMMVNLTQL